MSAELKITIKGSYTKGNLTGSFGDSSDSVDVSTARDFRNVQAIGTTQEALVVNADISTPGFAYFKNMDATNYIQIGVVVSATFYPCAKLKAGEQASFRLDPAATYYAKANTSACDLLVQYVSD